MSAGSFADPYTVTCYRVELRTFLPLAMMYDTGLRCLVRGAGPGTSPAGFLVGRTASSPFESSAGLIRSEDLREGSNAGLGGGHLLFGAQPYPPGRARRRH